MRMRQQAQSVPSAGELLGDLYGSLQEPERFGAFTSGLAACLRSHLVAIQNDDGSHAHSVRRHFGIDADPFELSARDDAGVNQFLLRGADTLLSEGVLDCARFFRPGELERTAFYADVLVPMDVHHSLGVLIASEGQRFVGLSVSRCKRSSAFEGADVELLRWLKPHLGVVHALQARQALLSVPSANEAQPGLATFCLGWEGELLDANLSASDMLVEGDSPLRLRERKLWLKMRSDREVMADRLAGLEAGKYAGGAAHWAIHDAIGGIWAFVAARTVPMERLPTDLLLSVPRIVVKIRPVESLAPGRLLAFRETFGLTSAEADLAAILLDLGSLSACRLRLEKSYETMRTQLRALFAKTGTTCQAELIRTLQLVSDL